MKKWLIALVPLIVIFSAFLVMKKSDHLPLSAQEDLSVQFTSYMNQTRGVQKIQLVESTAVEVIERTSKYSLFWDTFKFPNVVVLARVPTTYTYYVDLEKPFKLSFEGETLTIQAPPLEANPPAPDISGISYEVREGSVFRNTQTAFDELRRTITPLLKQKAELNRHHVQGEAEKQLELLVHGWLRSTQKGAKLPEKTVVIFGQDLSSP